MTHGQRQPIDLELVRQLQVQGVPLQQMANRLQIPRSTLRDQLKRALPVKMGWSEQRYQKFHRTSL